MNESLASLDHVDDPSYASPREMNDISRYIDIHTVA